MRLLLKILKNFAQAFFFSFFFFWSEIFVVCLEAIIHKNFPYKGSGMNHFGGCGGKRSNGTISFHLWWWDWVSSRPSPHSLGNHHATHQRLGLKFVFPFYWTQGQAIWHERRLGWGAQGDKTWVWQLFGTLQMPTAKRPKPRFKFLWLFLAEKCCFYVTCDVSRCVNK